MTDVLTPDQRRINMSRIRNKDTRPEIIVRSLVHGMGYRYSLHNKLLIGKPDLVLVKYHKIIFVHGCFWHMHKCKYGKVIPKTHAEFWKNKRMGNVTRDRKIIQKLKQQGWNVMIIWECWTKDAASLNKRLEAFLQK
jgi:DNA mismatch endonuclease, patch repair protein